MNQIIGSVSKKLWYLIAWAFLLFSTEAFGQLTATEDLIRKEIDRLGGAWEGQIEPAMVEFIGPHFDARQFEMLSHLKTVRILTIHNCDVSTKAIQYIAQMEGLEHLEIFSSKVDGTGISHMKNNRKLKTLLIEDVNISDAFLAGLTKLPQLQELYVDYSIVPQGFDIEILKMTSLKRCEIFSIVSGTHKPEDSYTKNGFTFNFILEGELQVYRDKKNKTKAPAVKNETDALKTDIDAGRHLGMGGTWGHPQTRKLSCPV